MGDELLKITLHWFYSESDAIKIIYQILEEVNYKLQLNIVQRDIK